MARSKTKKVSPEMFEYQKKVHTRNQVSKLLNSEQYKSKFSVVKRVYDERTELS